MAGVVAFMALLQSSRRRAPSFGNPPA